MNEPKIIFSPLLDAPHSFAVNIDRKLPLAAWEVLADVPGVSLVRTLSHSEYTCWVFTGRAFDLDAVKEAVRLKVIDICRALDFVMPPLAPMRADIRSEQIRELKHFLAQQRLSGGNREEIHQRAEKMLLAIVGDADLQQLWNEAAETWWYA